MCHHPVGTIPLVAHGVGCVASSYVRAEQNVGGALSQKKYWCSEARLKHSQNISSQHIESSLLLPFTTAAKGSRAPGTCNNLSHHRNIWNLVLVLLVFHGWTWTCPNYANNSLTSAQNMNNNFFVMGDNRNIEVCWSLGDVVPWIKLGVVWGEGGEALAQKPSASKRERWRVNHRCGWRAFNGKGNVAQTKGK